VMGTDSPPAANLFLKTPHQKRKGRLWCEMLRSVCALELQTLREALAFEPFDKRSIHELFWISARGFRCSNS
jgi:hypothetical protein